MSNNYPQQNQLQYPYNVNRNLYGQSQQQQQHFHQQTESLNFSNQTQWNQPNQNHTQSVYYPQWKPPPPPSWGKSQISLTHNSSQLIPQETSVNKDILKEIKSKSELYETTKEQIITQIKNKFEKVIDKIKETENKIIEQVCHELGENPFSTLLAKIYSGITLTDYEIKKVLSKKISQDFGPDEKIFQRLYNEIESFKEWQNNNKDTFSNINILSDCVWKKCPDNVDEERKYTVDENNYRIVSKMSNNKYYCTVIGSIFLSLKIVSSWSVKILKSKKNDGSSILVGITSFDVNQNEYVNYSKNGWYFHCGDSALYSGPPHNYEAKKYGTGKNLKTGDIISVVMNTTSAKGELSFVVNSVNLGVAFEEIPLDKPLVPCALLYYKGDSIELDLSSRLKENVDSSVSVPSNITTKSDTWNSITLTWDAVDGAEFYQIEVDGKNAGDASTVNTFTKNGIQENTKHNFRVRVVKDNNSVSGWSDVVKGKTHKKSFEMCFWKECPDDANIKKKYVVDENNPRFVTKVGGNGYYSIIGNILLPQNKVISWNIKILKSRRNDGDGIFIGVAPFDINQDEYDNYNKCGWYFNCQCSLLNSGPPHSYWYIEYGPTKDGGYVHTGDTIGVVMDATTAKGELSFTLNGVNLGVAYEGIPFDKPLVPCVILWHEDDSVELDLSSEVKETIEDCSIPVPSNIKIDSVTWDSITFTWDTVNKATFYQIEVDGDKRWNASTINSFTKAKLLAKTEHTFRVRTVRGNKISEWSGAMKGKTVKELKFHKSVWKECPNNVDKSKKYLVNENNPRVATKIGDNDYYSTTIIGNTPIPLNNVTSWNIKILKSRNNNGFFIYVGVAPFDIDQNNNYGKCGWYFDCYKSYLWSGSPHNYEDKTYGPRKGNGGYIHTGDSIGFVMDTTTEKGELSFVLGGVNCGIAFEGIPLDKPLVPCVLLYKKGDSVEFDTSEVKENVNTSIPVPVEIPNDMTISACGTIVLSWYAIEGADFYQIEMNGNHFFDVSKTSTFTKRGLLPDTEHNFRVRAVRGTSVSKWSNIMKRTVEKVHKFQECVWMGCPEDIPAEKKYSVDENNSRIVTLVGVVYGNGCSCVSRSTIIGSTFIPINTVTSWSIKLLKPNYNDGEYIYVGVAPFDIDQSESNRDRCGWYFYCYDSTLYSGPPHNYRKKEYGLNKEKVGEYVHEGDTIGVVMDTTTSKGNLSFALNEVNLGVAYEGIPLDKPLVPCVLPNPSCGPVELII